MFGFVIGTVCLIALIAVLGRRRWRHGYYGHGCGHGYGCGCGGGSCGYGGGHGRGWGPRAWLWGVSRRLGATPEQEKVFRDEVVAFIDQARGLTEALKAARTDLAGAIRDERLDAGRLQALFDKQQEVLDALRKKAGESIARVHATLDAEQRRTLAELIETGPRRHGWAAC